MPKNIGEMVNLEEAWLNDNHIRELPDSMFELRNLKTLWMSSKTFFMIIGLENVTS